MHSFFKKYKHIHRGQTAYILGSGPSLNSFQEIEPGIYMGGNNVHLRDYIRNKLDYLFFTYRGYKRYYRNSNTVYGNFCQKIKNLPVIKFCAVENVTDTSFISTDIPDIEFYKITNHPFNAFINIECEKLWNFSIVFGMMQFAAYTGVKKIYLVGCDCTSGYFFNENYKGMHFYEDYIKVWERMKEYMNAFYPDIQIISINPMGLKGLFLDKYIELGAGVHL